MELPQNIQEKKAQLTQRSGGNHNDMHRAKACSSWSGTPDISPEIACPRRRKVAQNRLRFLMIPRIFENPFNPVLSVVCRGRVSLNTIDCHLFLEIE